MRTKSIYIDTNLFIYLSKPTSPFYQKCADLIRYCKANKILIATSAETIQEIIHYSKNVKQLASGVAIARNTLNLISKFYPITESTIQIYLNQAEIYKTSSSRDLLHLAVCLEQGINTFITFDQDFRKFKELKVFIPDQALKQI